MVFIVLQNVLVPLPLPFNITLMQDILDILQPNEVVIDGLYIQQEIMRKVTIQVPSLPQNSNLRINPPLPANIKLILTQLLVHHCHIFVKKETAPG